jgi:hypothetical protein
MTIAINKRASVPLNALRVAIFIGIVSLVALAFRVIPAHASPWLLGALLFVPFFYVVGLVILKLVSFAFWLADRLQERLAKSGRAALECIEPNVVEAVDDQR